MQIRVVSGTIFVIATVLFTLVQSEQENFTCPTGKKTDDIEIRKFQTFLTNITINKTEFKATNEFCKVLTNTTYPSRSVIYENITANSTLDEPLKKLYQLTSSYENELEDNQTMTLTIGSNSTNIVVSLRVNKYYYWKTAQNAIAFVIFCMTLVGNISILHRLKSSRRRRSNVNYFIVQLAIADLCVGLFNVSLDAALRLRKEFDYGLLACKGSKFVSVVFIYASTFLLIALSIDRWEAVVKPLAFTRNQSGGYHLVATAWFLAFICAIPVTIKTEVALIQGFNQCYITYDRIEWQIYMIYLVCTVLVLPAVIIAICYTQIVYTIWRKGKLVMQQESSQQQLQLAGTRRNRANRSVDSSSSSLAGQECANSRLTSGSQAKNQASNVSDTPANGECKQDSCSKSKANYREDEFASTDEDEMNSSRINLKGLQVIERKPTSDGHQSELHHHQQKSSSITTEVNQSSHANCPQAAPAICEKAKKHSIKMMDTHKNYQAQQHGSGVIPKARIKTIKMTLVIMAAFILCWSPFCIINLYSVFKGNQGSNNPLLIALSTLSQSLAHLNSAVNPIIYWLFSSKRRNINARARQTAVSNDSRSTLRFARNVSLCNAMLCCRYLRCCFSSKTILTSSRVFEATGTSVAGSQCAVPSAEHNSSSTIIAVKPEKYKPLRDLAELKES